MVHNAKLKTAGTEVLKQLKFLFAGMALGNKEYQNPKALLRKF